MYTYVHVHAFIDTYPTTALLRNKENLPVSCSIAQPSGALDGMKEKAPDASVLTRASCCLPAACSVTVASSCAAASRSAARVKCFSLVTKATEGNLSQ